MVQPLGVTPWLTTNQKEFLLGQVLMLANALQRGTRVQAPGQFQFLELCNLQGQKRRRTGAMSTHRVSWPPSVPSTARYANLVFSVYT